MSVTPIAAGWAVETWAMALRGRVDSTIPKTPSPSVSVSTGASVRLCPNCGEPVAVTGKFCGQCGRRLPEPLAPPPPAQPHRPPTDDTMVWAKDGKAMVRVPAGKFLYGDNKEEKALPEFWIDKTPVTNAEFVYFLNESEYSEQAGSTWFDTKSNYARIEQYGGRWRARDSYADHPVTEVSWHGAQAYAGWAAKRLPIKAMWEKAARGIDGREFPWGEQLPDKELCNFDQNVGNTTPVGKYSPQGDSPYGCVDMAGNVWEWTSSDYQNRYKVVCGGCWNFGHNYVRITNRLWFALDYTNYNVGFRCVCVHINDNFLH